jgi:YHS domain-containing protein
VIRKLLWIIAAIGLAALLDRFLRRSARRPAPAGPSVPRFEGAMVRDRVCQTFLPRARALSLRCGAEEHFFCSEACKSSFLAARGSLGPSSFRSVS